IVEEDDAAARVLDRSEVTRRHHRGPHARLLPRRRGLALVRWRVAAREVAVPVLLVDVPPDRAHRAAHDRVAVDRARRVVAPRAARTAEELEPALEERIDRALVVLELGAHGLRARGPEEDMMERVVAD